MRSSVRIATTLAVAVLAAGAAIAFSVSPERQEGETATALVLFDRYEGTLGSGIEAAQNVADGAAIAEAVGPELRLRPRTVERSVRVSAEPATGVATVSATGRTAGEARQLAGAFTRELVTVSRARLDGRAREGRRYVRFLLAEGPEKRLPDTRRRILREEEALLTDFLSRVEANANPVIVQQAQVRAGATSGAGLVSGLLAAAAGLGLALGVTWLVGGRRRGGVTDFTRTGVAHPPADGPPADLGERPPAADSVLR